MKLKMRKVMLEVLKCIFFMDVTSGKYTCMTGANACCVRVLCSTFRAMLTMRVCLKIRLLEGCLANNCQLKITCQLRSKYGPNESAAE